MLNVSMISVNLAYIFIDQYILFILQKHKDCDGEVSGCAAS